MIAGERIELYIVPDLRRYYPPKRHYVTLEINDKHNVKWVISPCTEISLALTGQDSSILQLSADSRKDLMEWLNSLKAQIENLEEDILLAQVLEDEEWGKTGREISV